MREMKDSGIEWIGQIANTHKLVRLKYIAEILDEYRKPVTAQYRNQNADILYDYYGASGIIDKIDGYTIDDHVMLIGEDGANLKLRNLPLMYEVCGKAWINNHAHILKPMKNVDFYYLFYALESLDINNYITGSAQPKLNQENLKEILIPLPSYGIQRKVAYYLDTKCSEIDATAEDIQKEISLLEDYKKSVINEAVTKGLNPDAEMKDSGIEWIGEIPKDWSLKKGRYLFIQRNDRGNDDNLQLLSPSQKFGVIPQSLLENLTTQTAVKLKENTDLSTLKTVHKGDFCISLRSFQGGFEYSEYEGVVSPAYQIFYKREDLVNAYYKYIFKDSSFISKMNSYTMSLRDGKNISYFDFGNTYLPLPTIEEQQQIADYLDSKCSEIDTLIADKKRQLDILADYKKSIIYEYVTGKKEVI